MKILATGGCGLGQALRSGVAAVFLALCGPAQAHSNLQNAMWAQFESSLVRVAVNVSLREISVAQGISLDVQPGPDFDAFTKAVESHRSYLLAHLKLKADGRDLAGEVLKVTKPVEIGDVETTAYQYEMVFRFDGPFPREVTFYHSMLEEWPYAEGVPWNLSYILRTKRSDAPKTACWLLVSRVPAVIQTDPPSVAEPSSSLFDNTPPVSDQMKWTNALLICGLAGAAMALVPFLLRKVRGAKR